jgi:hypothetical protein
MAFMAILSTDNPQKDNFHKTIFRSTNSTCFDTQLN